MLSNTKSHLTAITRRKLSVPMRSITKWLTHPCLDYGCGKGFDADTLHLDKYDPHYFPTRPTKKYDNITCNYVLNVVFPEEEKKVLTDIDSLLTDDGLAFITVRRDVKTDGFTRKGTYQRNVELPLRIYKQTKTYCIYTMRKGELL